MEYTEGAGQPGAVGAAEEHPHPASAGPISPPNAPDRLVYLDHAATAPMLPEAVAAMIEELARLGNPSSLHNAGRRARRVVGPALTECGCSPAASAAPGWPAPSVCSMTGSA